GLCGNNNPKWKREIVSGHRFENIDLDVFHDPSCTSRFGYIFVFITAIKSVCVCLADLYTAVSLLVIGQTTVTPAIPTEYSKWIFLACIMVSYLLIVWDLIKARYILKTDNISCSFTSVIVNKYLSMKDYRYHCLFKSINSSTKGIDGYAFFVFFTLKGWKRLLLAEAPRQVINVVTLEALAPAWLRIIHGTIVLNNEALGDDVKQQILTGTMAFSVLVFAVSFLLVCAAAILYIPLFCHIRGNLKEYCCHKVDKRIAEILRKQASKSRKVHYRTEQSDERVYCNYQPASNYRFIDPHSSSSELVEKPVYASDLSPSISDRHHLLARDDQNYFVDDHKDSHSIEGLPILQHYQSRHIPQQLPYLNQIQPYYTTSQHNVGSPTPSTYVNEQRFPYTKFPQGY
ncbi:hypothetical protein INT47_010452, partial [Mucor saturninus]